MEIQQLRHFLAAVRCGNIGKAAEEEFITQSGLSRSIKNLETLLGVQLLVRSSRGISPTAFGEALIPHAVLVINNARMAAEAITNIAQKRTGQVTIGVTLNYGYYFIPGVICQLLERYPGISVDVLSSPFQNMMDMLVRAEVDLLFGLVDANYCKPEIEVRELFVTRSIVVARPDHPLAGKGEVSANELIEHEWVMLNSAGFQNAFAEYFHRKCRKSPLQIVRTSSLALLRQIVIRTSKLTVLPKEIVANEIAAGTLVQVSTETPADFAWAGLALNKSSIVTPAMEALISIIEEKSAQMPDQQELVSNE